MSFDALDITLCDDMVFRLNKCVNNVKRGSVADKDWELLLGTIIDCQSSEDTNLLLPDLNDSVCLLSLYANNNNDTYLNQFVYKVNDIVTRLKQTGVQ